MITFPLRAGVPLVASLLVSACASVPQQQVTLSGSLPAGRSYSVVMPDKDAPPLAAQAGLEACLQQAGLTAAKPGQLLVQTSYALRPARAAVLAAGAEPDRKVRKPARDRDRAALALTVTDRATGAVQWRGMVTRLLGKGEQAGDGAALVAPLCAALKAPPGPASG